MSRNRFDKYDVWAGVVIFLAVGLRLVLVLLSWPGSYEDEATLGLMALHIASHGAHPLLYYGQDYLGSLEAYLGAGFFHLFGPSTTALRLGLIPIFGLFLTCLYLLGALLYSKGLAIFSIAVVGLGAPDVLLRQLMAAGGTPELFFFTTLLLLLTAWLALSSDAAPREQRREQRPGWRRAPFGNWRRLLAYGAWGVVAGLDIWSHLLCLPFVLCAGLLLVIFCRRELRLPEISMLVLFLLVGASPLIIYKVTVPVTPNQLSVFEGIFGGGYHEPSYPSPLPAQNQVYTNVAPSLPGPVMQVAGTLFVGIPIATSGDEICSLSYDEAWPLTTNASVSTRVCSGVHGAWSMLLIVLLVVAAASALRGFRQQWYVTPGQQRPLEKRRAAIRQAARLMILAALGLMILAFVTSPPASAGAPWTSARYLVGFLIAMPALLYPLWEKKATLKKGRAWGAHLKRGMRYGLLVLVFAASLLGTIDIFTIPLSLAHISFSKIEGLTDDLLRLGATHIYANSDDCTRISFTSDERVICAVLDKGLQPGLDRYFPYRAMVANWPDPAYVFPAGSPQAVLFQLKAAQQHITYRTYHLYGYDIFTPHQRVAP